MVDKIFAQCKTVSKVFGIPRPNKNNREAVVAFQAAWMSAYNDFITLLKDVVAYCSSELKGKIYSDNEVAIVLLDIDGFSTENTDAALEPMRIHLFSLGQFAEKLLTQFEEEPGRSADSVKTDVEKFQTIFLDFISDAQLLISEYEFLINRRIYKKQVNASKYTGVLPNAEPEKREVEFGKRASLTLFDRRDAINTIFWLEHFDDLKDISFRNLRPHAAMLIRQGLELMWKEVVGFNRIVDKNGNTLKQFTQIGWKFLNCFRTKEKDTKLAVGTDKSWSLSLPMSFKTISLLNSWSNSFVHNPWNDLIYVQWFATELFWKLSKPGLYKGVTCTFRGNIVIEDLKCMQAEFELFVARENSSAFVEWPVDRKPIGAFVASEGTEPPESIIRKMRLSKSMKNLKDLIKHLGSEILLIIFLLLNKKPSFRNN